MQTIKLHPAFYPLIADGRKTMTRRVVKEALGGRWELFNLRRVGGLVMALLYHEESARVLEFKCPYRIGETVKWGEGEGRITDIRCERLHDISEEDCHYEGVLYRRIPPRGVGPMLPTDLYSHPLTNKWREHEDTHTPRQVAFQDLWQHIYPDGPESWESNPCVWALTIEKIGDNNVLS